MPYSIHRSQCGEVAGMFIHLHIMCDRVTIIPLVIQICCVTCTRMVCIGVSIRILSSCFSTFGWCQAAHRLQLGNERIASVLIVYVWHPRFEFRRHHQRRSYIHSILLMVFLKFKSGIKPTSHCVWLQFFDLYSLLCCIHNLYFSFKTINKFFTTYFMMSCM